MKSILDNSYAYGINDSDQVTGQSPSIEAYRYTPSVGIDLLPPLGDRIYMAGYSINAAGSVAGVASSSREHSHVPFLFTDAGGTREVGDFGGRAFARDLNNHETVVGEYEPSSGSRRAWVWSESAGVGYLSDVIDPALDLRVKNVWRINDAGQILAQAYDKDSNWIPILLTPVCPPASSQNYGEGFPGTLGVPGLTASADPVLGSTIDVQLENSLGSTTGGLLFVGLVPTSIQGSWGGDLLVLPSFSIGLAIPAGGFTLSASIPDDEALCGLSVYVQGLEFDTGAAQGISNTPGLELILGR